LDGGAGARELSDCFVEADAGEIGEISNQLIDAILNLDPTIHQETGKRG
jgi:hypothetical protein